jgi:hypothetical protein
LETPDWRDAATTERNDGTDQHVATERLTTQEEAWWCQRFGFTPGEWRRLAFLRWLYHRGRLTEWP